jgi:hypothetical protein
MMEKVRKTGQCVLPEIPEQLENVHRLHARDLAAGYAGVFLPRQLEKKYKNAARDFYIETARPGWQHLTGCMGWPAQRSLACSISLASQARA